MYGPDGKALSLNETERRLRNGLDEMESKIAKYESEFEGNIYPGSWDSMEDKMLSYNDVTYDGKIRGTRDVFVKKVSLQDYDSESGYYDKSKVEMYDLNTGKTISNIFHITGTQQHVVKPIRSEKQIRGYVDKMINDEKSANWLRGTSHVHGNTVTIHTDDKAYGNSYRRSYVSSYKGPKSLQGNSYENKATRLSQLLKARTGGKIKHVIITVVYD